MAMNLPPHACTPVEVARMKAAAEVYWAAMEAIVDGDPGSAGADANERASMIAHMAQQGILYAVEKEAGRMTPGVILNACGRMIGQIISQAPTPKMVARARAHLEEQIRIGADDFLAVSPP